jgi:hypothetical protein
MKCPRCVEQGLRSKIYPGASMSTGMASNPYFDEDGNYHNDDPNIRTSYCCSEGHVWESQTCRGKTTLIFYDAPPVSGISSPDNPRESENG